MADLQLQPGERQLADVRLHWFFIFHSVTRFLATIFTLGLSAYLIRQSYGLTITDRRLVMRSGVFTKNVVEMELGRVAQVETSSSWMDRVWGIGRLKIIALDQFNFDLHPLANPDALKDVVMTAVADWRRSSHAPGAAAATPQADALSALERLGKLRESGVLSDAEFEAKKRELLAKV
jgi:membrane protein YdbS with pleckstrin-like domain